MTISAPAIQLVCRLENQDHGEAAAVAGPSSRTWARSADEVTGFPRVAAVPAAGGILPPTVVIGQQLICRWRFVGWVERKRNPSWAMQQARTYRHAVEN